LPAAGIAGRRPRLVGAVFSQFRQQLRHQQRRQFFAELPNGTRERI
jgi:hypothetical protein